MKCAYHPQEESAGSCGMCGKPLCEECKGTRTGANILCGTCAALSAAQDAANVEDERQVQKEQKQSEAVKGKNPHLAMIIVVILAVIVLLANGYMYMGSDVPDVVQFEPNQHPLLTADLINQGIEDYAKDHGGKFPGSLNELSSKYVPYEKITPQVLDMFSYRRLSPTAYELRFKDAKNEQFSDIVFGKEDQ